MSYARTMAAEGYSDYLASRGRVTTDGELKLTVPGVLKVPSISQRDNVAEIVEKFGEADKPSQPPNSEAT